MLNANKNQTISSLRYWITEIDRQLNKAVEKVESVISLERHTPKDPEKHYLYTEYKDINNEPKKNLNNILELIGHYISGHPESAEEFRRE